MSGEKEYSVIYLRGPISKKWSWFSTVTAVTQLSSQLAFRVEAQLLPDVIRKVHASKICFNYSDVVESLSADMSSREQINWQKKVGGISIKMALDLV